MMLKNYYGCSDKKLVELLNGNIFMQFFCDILISIDSLLFMPPTKTEHLPLVTKSKPILSEKEKLAKIEEQRKILAKEIKKERSTRLEGSFGKEKEHYNLKKIKGKTQKSEILWIFFGIHTANALEIGRRILKKAQEIAA